MKSGTARSSSSCRMRVVTLDCTRCSRSAARVTPPSRTTALKIIRSDRSIHLSKRSTTSQLFILSNHSASVKTAARVMVLPSLAVQETPREKNMPRAYWIVRVSVRDEQGYPEYLAAAGPAFQKFAAKFIVRGGKFETMEGNARERNVVVEFKDRATAFACYQSPEYQAARTIRQKYADADFIIIEGVAD